MSPRREEVPFDEWDWDAQWGELVQYACDKHFGADEEGAREYLAIEHELMALWAEENETRKRQWMSFAKRWLLRNFRDRPPPTASGPQQGLFGARSTRSSQGSAPAQTSRQRHRDDARRSAVLTGIPGGRAR